MQTHDWLALARAGGGIELRIALPPEYGFNDDQADALQSTLQPSYKSLTLVWADADEDGGPCTILHLTFDSKQLSAGPLLRDVYKAIGHPEVGSR